MSLEKWLVAGLGQGKHKMSPRRLVPGSKGTFNGMSQKGTEASLRRFSLVKSGTVGASNNERING